MPNENSYNPKPDLALDLNVRQEQRLSQQQRQALLLLQSQRAELEAAVRKELDTNPALEEYYPEEDDGEDEAFEKRFSPDSQDENEKENEGRKSEYADRLDTESEEGEKALDKLNEEDEDWQNYYREEAGEDIAYSDQKTMRKNYDFVMNSLSAPSTLADDLKDQFALDLPKEYEPIYTYLISSLDEKGFLTESADEMAKKAGRSKSQGRKSRKTSPKLRTFRSWRSQP